MEIIDKPLSEIIKEQKIGESLRKGRRGGNGRNEQQNARNNGRSVSRNNSRGGRGGGRAMTRDGRNNTASNEQRRRRFRRPLRFRGDNNRLRRIDRIGDKNGSINGRFRRRYAMDMIDDRRDRSVKSGGPQRRGLTALERNDRTRASRRREALSRARSRFSRS